MYKLVKLAINIIRTIKFNFLIFPFKIAIKLPIRVFNKIDIVNVKKGSIVINEEVKRFMITFGAKGTDGINERRDSFLRIDNGGHLIIKGSAHFAEGISIRVSNKGTLTLGDNFRCNKNCFISCDGNTKIGDNALLGWNVNIRDSDGHTIYDLITNEKNVSIKDVIIGNEVWIGANVDIMKGTVIKQGCIVAYRSCLLSEFKDKNCIIGGYPAKVLRNNVRWNK